MASSTLRAPVLSPMSPWAVKWTAGSVGEEGPADEEDSAVLGGAVAGGPDVPGETGVPDGGGGGPCWHAVSSSASESMAGAMPGHLRCFDSPGMIPHITEHITEPSLMPLQAGNGIYC